MVPLTVTCSSLSDALATSLQPALMGSLAYREIYYLDGVCFLVMLLFIGNARSKTLSPSPPSRLNTAAMYAAACSDHLVVWSTYRAWMNLYIPNPNEQ
ncbi:hypothetical protein FNV43_RR09615 [Rhamnella rubrinervis]|uniref:Uncharacterized protein n=1 Tax=Rhamnella rubrinervis TaxID=2594499 RepID=A0A8K0HB16_9ROSA|nr:hypothetical protein FNV43_RR09615 [Rhamnella rubrinervis]